MNINETPIVGCYEITPKIFEDNRGIFFESYNKNDFSKHIASIDWVQDNFSISHENVFRGLHFQTGIHAQNKLVSVVNGSVVDIVVDCRVKSPSFKKSFKITLSNINRKQIFIPAGCAHGFLSLEDNTMFTYKCDKFYNKESESGIYAFDFELNLWDGWDIMKFTTSKKDNELPDWNICYKFDVVKSINI